MKKVSVIIPTHNRPVFLKAALESVLNQTYKNIEVIVVEDGSSNEVTENLCNEFMEVVYYTIPVSGGPAAPRNFGYMCSSGEYIAFLDDDDLWATDKLELQVEILDNNPDFGLVHSYCEVINEFGKPTGEIIGRPGSEYDKHGDVKLKMMGNWTLMMPTPLVRRSVIDEVGLFNTSMPSAGEDTEFWTRCSFYTRFYYIDKALAYYRRHSNGLSKYKTKYVSLPLYLNNALSGIYNKDVITRDEYVRLRQNICLSQAKYISVNPSRTLFNLFRLNPIWIINFRVIKTLFKRLVK